MLLGGNEECCCVKKVRFNSVIAQYPHEHILYTHTRDTPHKILYTIEKKKESNVTFDK